MTVLVTGGSGFVGKALQITNPDWLYVSSKDCELTDRSACREMFESVRPNAVIHLAGRVGGIIANSQHQADFFYKNSLINLNVVHEAYRSGVPRLLAALSTCAFPDVVQSYPFYEEDLFSGLPTEANMSYGYSKRALHMQCLSYRKEYGVNYSTFAPSNVYGPGSDFNPETSHFVSALVKKVWEAKKKDSIEFYGDGLALKQQLYVSDLCRALPLLLEKHHTDEPIIVAPYENLRINDMVLALTNNCGKEIDSWFNGKFMGQRRKDGCNDKFMELFPDFEFTAFDDGVKETYDWYGENYG